MIGIVIVSHSATLATGVRELAEQMAQGRVKISAAGGIDDPDQPIGTDPIKVLAAIEEAYSADGVVVLMDLGSAVMSAEVALEMLDPDQAANVRLCAAPLVEGAVAAVTQAAIGAPLEAIVAEANGALAAKRAQLGVEESAPAMSPTDTTPAADVQCIELVIPNRLGLHARPAARLVGLAGSFAAAVTLVKNGRRANAKSINQVATLGARQGDRLVVEAAGDDAAAALNAIKALAADNFGDRDGAAGVPQTTVPAAAAPAQPAAEGAIGAAPGIAVGPVLRYEASLPPLPQHMADDPAAEWQQLKRAIDAAEAELGEVEQSTRQRAGQDEAAIFDAHRLILRDPDLHATARAALDEHGHNAAVAWQQAIDSAAGQYAALDDAYMRERAGDVRDVGRRVLRHLLGAQPPALDAGAPIVLVAHDLAPSDTARLSPDKVLGIITEAGGATGHSAILARALGIPAVVGAAGLLGHVQNGQTVALDGSSGRLWLDPDADKVAALQQARAEWLAQRQTAQAAGQARAQLADGTHIEVAANIGGPHDVAVALQYGAEGVGLFRTEFLFMDRPAMPDEAEQTAAYRAAAEALGGRPLIIRTLDVGGDKPVAYIEIGAEANPFLGWRGIRYGLDNVELLKTQLRAICRVSANHPVRVMFPMISTLDELQRARGILSQAQTELNSENVAFDAQMPVGIMVEVPSTVQVADTLAAHVDFFSIGTNDLTQYMMAADRGNARVAALADALQPAVLRAIRQVAQAAESAGIWTGMCGELAGNPLAAPVLVGLGLTEVSMAAPAIPAVKQALRARTLQEARTIARQALDYTSAADVRAYLTRIAAD